MMRALRVMSVELRNVIESPIVYCVVTVVCLFLSQIGFAAVINVPADHATIQAAINAASDSDEIIVSPGTYYENIHFDGKNIILRSTAPTSPTIVATTIIDGRSTDSVVTFAGTELTTCVLSGFTITMGNGYHGGGIYGNGGCVTIENNVIRGNTAQRYGGGICLCDGTIQNNTIAHNASRWYGGGLHDCDGIIQNNTVCDNSAGAGGGLYECDGVVRNNTVSKNEGFGEGGGLSRCDGTIENNDVRSNYGGWGGGLYWCMGEIRSNVIFGNNEQGLYKCGGIIEDNVIAGNWAFSGSGLRECDGTIQNNIISGNWADTENGEGGGLYWCNGTIRNNTVSHNWAAHGGGLYYCDGKIENNVIFGNLASGSWGHGGGLFCCDGIIQCNTVFGNWASVYGGGLFQCRGTIRNCIIWRDSATAGDELYDCFTPTYSCIRNWTDVGVGNNCDDPQMVDPANGDFHLKPTSPCIDAGCFVPDLSYDFEGSPRPYIATMEPRGDGSHFDIGADEYVREAHSNSWLFY